MTRLATNLLSALAFILLAAISFAADPVPNAAPTATAPTTKLAVKFNNATIDYVLDYLATKAGFAIVKLQVVPTTGIISIEVPHPISADNFPALLDIALEPTGLGVSQTGRTLTIDSRAEIASRHLPGPPPLSIPKPPTTMLSWDYDFGSIDAALDFVATKSGYVIIKQFPVAGRIDLNPAHGLSSDDLPAILNTTVQDLNATVIQKAGVLIVVPRKALDNSSPATQPAAAAATAPTTMLSLNYKDVPIDDVLNDLAAKSGYIIVKYVPAPGRITLISPKPVSIDDLPALLDTALQADGYSVLPSDHVLFVDTRAGPSTTQSAKIPVHYGGDPKQIADTEDIITQVIPMKNPTEIRSDWPTTPSITPNPDGSKSILVTAPSKDVKRIAQVVLEIPPGDMFVRHLLNADAQAAANQINAMYPPTTAPARADLQPIIARADERSNNVVVSGPPEKLPAIWDFLTKLDASTSTTKPSTAPTGSRGGQ